MLTSDFDFMGSRWVNVQLTLCRLVALFIHCFKRKLTLISFTLTGPPSSSVLHRTLLRLKCRGLFRLLIICRRMSWWATWCGSSKCSSWMAAPPSLCRGNHLEVEILAEVAQGNTIKPPIGISHPRWTAVAEISATQMNQVPPVISNTATAGTTTIRMTGVATDTMTAEVATNIMARGVAAVATKIIDGDDIETQRDFCKDFSPSQICGQLT